MGRGIDPFSDIRSRIQRTSTQVDDAEEAASAQKDDSDSRSSNDLTESQEQMANDLAERMGRELPEGTGRFEPESLINSEDSDSTDPLAERLQDRADDPFNATQHDDRLSRPDLTGPTRPESSYELFDPTTTRTGLDAFDNLGRPGLGGDSEDDGFDVPSLFQGASKAGGPGYKATYDEQEGLVAPKTNGTFAEEYPRLNKLFGQFFGTDNAAGAKTPKGEAIDAALKDIDESSTPTPTPAPAEEPKKDETLLEKAVREAAEEAAAAAAAEAAAAAAAETSESADKTDPKTPPDDYVDPEKAMALSKYLRETSGYQGTPRDGDIDWDDQPKDSTGGPVIDQSDLYGDRPEGQLGQADIPDEPLVLGNDHDINWGPDAGNPGSGLKEDVPGDVGRPTDLSHLNPENESSDGSRLADRTIRPADGTPTPLSEGARRAAESSTDKLAAALSSDEEATSTVRSMSAGGETQTVDLSSGTESNDEGDEDESAAEEPTANDESNTITVSQSPDDDATIVFTPGNGQPTDTVTFESGQEETTDSDNTNTETTASASAGRVLTPVEGRVTASDLRDMQLGRGFFDEAPAPAEDTNTDTPRADEQEGDASVLPTGVLRSDLRIPTPLDDLQLQPLRTFEPVGASDDDDGMADDE